MSSLVAAWDFEGASFRSVEKGGAMWFVAADVCACLGIAEPRSVCRDFDDDEKGVHSVHTPGGPQEMLVVSEPGLYRLIRQSRKPAAKRFRRFVDHEVLPQIRRHGSYIGPYARGVISIPDDFAEHIGNAIGMHLRPIDQKVDIVDGKVDEVRKELRCVRGEVTELSDHVQRFHKRRRPSQATIEEAMRVILRFYGGRCPVDKTTLIVDPVTFKRLPQANIDHWYSPSRNRSDEVWLVCEEVNRRLANDGEYRLAVEHAFKSYQVDRERLSPRLFR